MDAAWPDVAELYAKIKNIFGFELKKEQIQVIDGVIRKKDVSAVLPTGFGKSMCYVLPPLLMDQVHPETRNVSLVVSPLLSLMEDQRIQLEARKIKSVLVSHQEKVNFDALVDAEVSVIFTTPESLQNSSWRKVFLNDRFRERLCVFAVDEAHCVSDWGEEFRPEYRTMSSVRSLIDVPFVALTATATQKVQDDIQKYLMLDDENLIRIAVVPDRPNICLVTNAGCTQDYNKELGWLLTYLKESDPTTWHKTIIFCRSYSSVYNVWSWNVEEIGDDGFKDSTRAVENRRLEMYHGSTDQDSKDRIHQNFIAKESTIKILVCTIAFGMGISIPNIDLVIHWGTPKSTLSYWQEVGRAGRSGQPSVAVMYPYKRSLLKTITSDDVRNMVSSKTCIRHRALKELFTTGMDIKDIKLSSACREKSCHVCECECCLCCSVCFSRCECGGKLEPFQRYLL